MIRETQESKKGKLYMTATELLQTDVKEPNYIVKNLIKENGITMFAGSPKSSKTMFALNLGVCVSSGKPVFNKYPVIKGRVAYFDEENGLRDLQNKLKRILRGHNLKECDIDFIIFKDFKLEHKDNKELRNKHQIIIRNYIKERNPILIICDSMVRMMKGRERDETDVREVFDFIKPFKSETSWLLLHHTPKNSQDARGSGDWSAFTDDMFILHRRKGEHKFTIKSKFSRGDEWLKGDNYKIKGKEKLGQPLTFEYEGETNVEIETQTFGEKCANHIKKMLEEKPKFTIKDVEKLDFKKNIGYQGINILLEEGVIKKGKTKGAYEKV